MTTHHRTIWVSDLHIGTKGFRADLLLDFLNQNTADTLYLVGDIIDMWALSRKMYFPASHLKVVKKLIKLSSKCRVVYVRGNHDEALDHFIPFNIGKIEVVDEIEHVMADGKRFLVTHGDKYDQVILYAKWLAHLGDIGYIFLMKSNGWINWVRRKFGFGYWSLSAYAKHRVKGIVSFIGDFENAVSRDVAQRGYDGVVCGHIHHAEIKTINGIVYANDGDFVEGCTALVEDDAGALRIIDTFATPVVHTISCMRSPNRSSAASES